MPKKALEILTESMFYVLMALSDRPMCGIDIAAWIKEKTRGRVSLGPAPLYTVLGKFQKEDYIEEIEVDGRKRTYRVTARGRDAYLDELQRLRRCLMDADGKE